MYCITETNNELSLNHAWKHNNKWNTINAIVNRTAQSMITGSEEAFIAEYYRGYSKYNHSTTFEYHV